PASTYASGLQASLTVSESVLQPGPHRFTAGTALGDRSGNRMTVPYERFFHVEQLPGFSTEMEPNNSIATATPLPMARSLPRLISGAGRGRLTSNNDEDFWSFEAEAGDQFVLAAENPGNPGNSGLNFRLYLPDGSQIFSINAATNGVLLQGPLTLDEPGTYT